MASRAAASEALATGVNAPKSWMIYGLRFRVQGLVV